MQSCAMCCTHPLGKFQNQVDALLVLERSILQAGKQGWAASSLKVWQGSQQCARLPPVPDTYKVYYVGVAQRGVNRNLSFNLQHAAHIRAVTGLYIMADCMRDPSFVPMGGNLACYHSNPRKRTWRAFSLVSLALV